jgi:uncharacterized protein (DUF1697 family)
MALVVFLRGVNVGGHRRFRPSVIAKELGSYGVVNVGAAGTLVVADPGSRLKFRAALIERLPFEATMVFCEGRDLIRLVADNPFRTLARRPDTVRFLTLLSKTRRVLPATPLSLPPDGEWFVRVIAATNRFALGVYRRHMKTIAYLGQLDKVFGVPTTTRNWNTISTVVRVLKDLQTQQRAGAHWRIGRHRQTR